METKVKKFSKKLLALFLAVVMAVGCFTSVVSVYGASKDPGYTDLDAAANFMNWAELTDEQTAGALLDWLDSVLGGVNYHLNVDLSVAGKIDGYIDSVDGLLNLIDQAEVIINDWGGTLGGDIQNIDLTDINNLATDSNTISSCGVGYRSQNDAKTILLTVAEILYQNTHDFGGGKNVIRQFLLGEFNLGWILPGVLNMLLGSDNIYDLLQDALGMEDGYESNLVYNLVQSLVLNAFYKDSGSSAYQEAKAKKLDTMMFDLLSTELLQKISVKVTYGSDYTDAEGNSVQDNSKTRYENIQAYMASNSCDYQTAAAACGYDPNLVYSIEEEFEGNILLFAYGSPDSNGNATSSTQVVDLNETDNLLDFGMRALKIAWQTVLKDSIGLLHANYSTDRGHGTNFDNLYYYWAISETSGVTWDEDNLTEVYKLENLTNWANHTVVGDLEYNEETQQWEDKLGNTYEETTNKQELRNDEYANVYDEGGRIVQQATMPMYTDYGAENPTEFLGWVKETFEYDRAATGDGNWRDIDPTQLFGKLRYSPMADYAFDMTTGPINLYFMQTGSKNIDAFFDGLVADSGSTTLISGLNNALVAAVKDIFINSNNVNNIENYPTLSETSSSDPATIASVLIGNAAKVFQYTADAADANILKAFYDNSGQTISEANLEEAALPLLIACLREINMLDPVRDSDWDKCANVEGIAYLALKEYLSYILPNNDYEDLVPVVEGKFSIEFTGEDNSNPILLMARDALGYILQSSVPIIDENGNKVFDAYNSEDYADVTIWDIFNNIACYYAYDKGVAALLGIYDESGNVAFNRNNTLWENIDLVVNKYFPVIGELQYGSADKFGAADSKDLIWNDLINGALNISSQKDGRCGIENFIYKLLTVASADPITADPIIHTVYDLVEKLVNGLFGARYSGQGFTRVVPSLDDLSALGVDNTRPFDAIIQRNVICYWTTTDATGGDGFLGSLVCNLFEILGGSTYGSTNAAQVDATWEGLMFIVEAVNNFIPSFVPTIGNHTLGTLETVVSDPSANVQNNAVYSSTLRVTNTSTGINRFYTDANGKQQEQGRYYMVVKNIATDNSDYTVSYSAGDLVAPDEIKIYPISGTGRTQAATVTVTTTYDIYKSSVDVASQTVNEKAVLIAENLTTQTFLYTTPELDWFYTCYNAAPEGENDFTRRFTNWEPEDGGETEYTRATSKFGDSGFLNPASLYVTYPKQIIIPNNNPGLVDQMGIRLRNDSRTSTRSFDGVFSFPQTAIQAYKVNGTNIDTSLSEVSGTNYAYVAIDVENGDILNYARLDYSTDGGETWDRGSESTLANGMKIRTGYTEDDLKNNASLGGKYITRTHVALTFEEACSAGIVTAVQRTQVSDTEYVYESVMVNTQSNRDLTKQLLGKDGNAISFSSPVNGIYLCSGNVSAPNYKATYAPWIAYDGSTSLEADQCEFAVCFFSSSNEVTGNIELIIADNDDMAGLESTYNTYNSMAARYQTSDYSDAQAATNLNTALKDALTAMSRPLNDESAPIFGSTYERVAKTVETTSIFGDLAYEPVASGESLPASIAAYTYEKNGYIYWNEQCTQPLYKRTVLTNVSNVRSEVIDGISYEVGTDAAGKEVIKNPDNNRWYVRNAVSYVYEWNFDYATPYYGATSTQATNSRGEKLYLQDQFAYRTADGIKTVSNSTTAPWAYKLAELEDRIVPNTPGVENRGLLQQAIDSVNYYGGVAEDSIKTTSLPEARERVSDVRQNLNNVNFDVLTYEQMVGTAKEVEAMYYYDAYKNHYKASDVTYDDEGNPVPNEGAQPIISCYESDWDSAWNDYLDNGGYSGVEIVSIEDRSLTKYGTTSSTIAVQDAIDNFELLYESVQTRDYNEANTGNQIAKEIVLSIGDAYNMFTVTQPATYGVDENGNTVVKTPAVISVTDGATLIRGAVDESGNLVNEGETVYTDDSWNMYTARLADAIASRQAETDTISNTYTLKSNLLIAEKALAEDVASGYNVTASLVVAKNSNGDTDNAAVNGNYTITLYEEGTENVVGTPYTFTSSKDANSFTLTAVPAGTYDMAITSDYSIKRTVKLIVSDHDIDGPAISIIACDFSGDGAVGTNDAITLYAQAASGGALSYDLNGDGSVGTNDAIVLYACAVAGSMPNVTIQ